MKKLFKFVIFSAAVLQMQVLHAEAIIGGRENTDDGYLAIVSSDGVAVRVTGDTPEGSAFVRGVAINSSGLSLVGGSELGLEPYMAFVSRDGVATRITGATPTPDAYLGTVDINESGAGIVGGQHIGANVPYVGMISPTGVVTQIYGAGAPVGAGSINSVAINDSGVGIAGGQDNGASFPYAAVISPDGEATLVSGAGAPVTAGYIFSVAINNSGAGIIGGRDGVGGTNTFASIVAPGGSATKVSGAGAPTGSGVINSVAINSSGTALIGGRDDSDPYAALVSSTGIASSLSGSSPQPGGTIDLVDINDSGMGILAGDHNGGELYAALVSPSGAAQLITGDAPPADSTYRFAAISESGVGLLGTTDPNDIFYAALVSPTGVASLITGEIAEGEAKLLTGDITDYLSFVDPISYGPANAFANPIIALSSNVLTNHLQRVPEREAGQSQTAALTADASDRIYQPQGQGCERANYAVWGAPFGLFATYDKGHSFPKLQEWSAGGIVGFDYLGWDNIVLGGGAAYSFQHVDYKSQGGHAEIHQELLTVYAAWQGNHISIDGALWGGIYQMHNKRKTLGTINSTSNVDGGIFAPHLRVGAPFKINNTVLTVEPYTMFDWINNWQGSIREKGSAGLNIRMDSHYVSLLRSEIGLRLMQELHYKSGDLTFEESGSYVNRAPFNAKKESAYYVGSVSTFSVQLFSDRVENLGALRLSGRFVPCNIVYPYVSLTYLGEFGANLMVNTFALEVGKRF